VIGVAAKVDEVPIVEEFFELFKTPWEFHRPGRQYDVVIATCDEIPEVRATLLIVYGSVTKSIDARHGISAFLRCRGGSLKHQKSFLPIYGDFLKFAETSASVACVTADPDTAGLRIRSVDGEVLRLGYDLFQEVRFLLSEGQPIENAHIPTLDIHITMLRDWILGAGIALLEIPPAPAEHGFVVCLTHDIDFVGIRNHFFDHSMWGFLYRSTVGAIRDLCRRRISMVRLLKMWRAVVSLPFVYLGWAKDFWDPFDWYLRVEKNLPTTYFFIPFKRRPGERVAARNGSRRATAYDITDLPQWTALLVSKDCEIGVHGIDSWHSAAKGRDELGRIAAVSGESAIGIRMHWLLRDQDTFRVLEQAGYAYDSTVGYNETIGYRSGTTQVFRPLGAQALLELPMHIQDGALFYSQRLDLHESEAWERCSELIENSRRFEGVLTVLWHDRSHGPERFWGDFYIRLVQTLKSLNGWFGTGAQVVGWFRKRREVRFERVEAADGTPVVRSCYQGGEILPPLKIRVHRPSERAADTKSRPEAESSFVDVPWNGKNGHEMDQLLQIVAEHSFESLRAGHPSKVWDRKGPAARLIQ
jgi:hypothetical protein